MAFFGGLQPRTKKSKEAGNGEWLREMFASGLIDQILEEYITYCSTGKDIKKGAKKESRFPNLAGFCRYLKIGTNDISELGIEYPAPYARILAVLEDEALNSELSTTLLGAYMKKRLNYEKVDEEHSKEGGALTVCFEHDILKDGE